MTLTWDDLSVLEVLEVTQDTSNSRSNKKRGPAWCTRAGEQPLGRVSFPKREEAEKAKRVEGKGGIFFLARAKKKKKEFRRENQENQVSPFTPATDGNVEEDE